MVLPSVDDTPLCRRKKKSSQSSRRGRRRRWQQVLFLILSDNEGGDSHQIESALFFQVLFGQVLSSHCHFVRKLFTFSLELKKKSRRRTHCWYVQRERCRRNDGGIRLAPNLRAECEKAEHPHQRGSRVSESSYLCVCVWLVFVPPPPSLLGALPVPPLLLPSSSYSTCIPV